jgi:tetratricopeptide (TPR) repeat protein
VIKQSKIAEKILKATDLAHQRKFDESLEIARRMLKERLDDGQKYRVHYLLGFCYKKQDRLDDAAEQFQLARDLNPDSDSAYFESGNVEFLRGNLARAEAIFGDVRDRGETNANKARWNLALVYQSKGAWEKALAELDALPTNSVHEFNRNSLRKSIRDAQQKAAAALKKAHDAAEALKHDRRDRAELFRRLMIGLVVVGVFVVAGLIFVLYRRLQRTPELSAQERADYTGKVMGGLFNMLSLLGGAMLGALLTR